MLQYNKNIQKIKNTSKYSFNNTNKPYINYTKVFLAKLQ